MYTRIDESNLEDLEWRLKKVGLMLAVLLLVFVALGSAAAQSDKVLFSQVKALSFEAGKVSRYRRTSALPQVTCDGGCAEVDKVRCLRQESLEWHCVVPGNKNLKLTDARITCEGFDRPRDAYILSGSCAVHIHAATAVDQLPVVPILLVIASVLLVWSGAFGRR